MVPASSECSMAPEEGREWSPLIEVPSQTKGELFLNRAEQPAPLGRRYRQAVKHELIDRHGDGSTGFSTHAVTSLAGTRTIADGCEPGGP